jgi:hypothetical protein
MSIQVTQGQGTVVATLFLGGAQYQQVITYGDHVRAVFPGLSLPSSYSSGVWMGGELAPSVVRIAGMCVRLLEVDAILTGGQAPAEFDVVFYYGALSIPPSDLVVPSLAAGDAQNLLHVVQVRETNYSLAIGGASLARCVPEGGEAVLAVATGDMVVRCGLVARGSFTLSPATSLSLAFVFARD